MNKKELFKEFVKNNPGLANSVNEGRTTWQNLFELYDLYGEDDNVFDEFKKLNNKEESKFNNMNIKEFMNSIKNINMDSVQKNINSLKKAVDFLGDFTTGNTTTKTNKVYNPRPINKFFDD